MNPCVCVENKLKNLEELSSGWKGEYINSISIAYGAETCNDVKDIETILTLADKKNVREKACHAQKFAKKHMMAKM